MICLLALLTAGKGSRTGMYTEIFVSWILQLFAFWFFNFIFFLENFFLPTTFTHTHTHEPHPRPTTHDLYPLAHDPRHLATLHAYHGSDVHSYAYGLLCHWRSKDSDPKHRNIRDMEGTSTYSTMRVECIVFYVDPKSVGSLNFLGKEQNIRLS